ncbi:hypothetical protein MIZ03_0153 [Rhodoferax lithotrophicus]|uniref:Uncharacterized protein n=1 Tax=Rhodoferax lithotrophicus TaxID=2798804 RepID=A0ABM7MGK5_9BURK|nr:hypothetical protein MIZ03_0153 [Rhodoferax sp. MIZ03]
MTNALTQGLLGPPHSLLKRGSGVLLGAVPKLVLTRVVE